MVSCGSSLYWAVYLLARCYSCLCLAHYDIAPWGGADLPLSINEPETIIKLGTFLLYVMLFLSFLLAYGKFDRPYTFTFLGSVLCLIFPVLLLLKDEEKKEKG